MLSSRAREYMQAMEATYGPDYLHERYATEAAVDPTDYDPETGDSGVRLPFHWWVEREADQWAARQQAVSRPVSYDPVSYQRHRLRRLRDRQRVNFDEDRAIEIDELSRALGEEESA